MNMTLFLLTHLILFAPIVIVFAYIIFKMMRSLDGDPYRCPLSPQERKKAREQAFQSTVTTFNNH